ncbi:integrase catalytic domain-containing protein [Trichonephila clavipes]|nr:integrase catalytic domain-containing protein [Trichonephila clavipes]
MKIDSTLGREKVIQTSSEELTFEPIPLSVTLASKRGISWGSEKGLLPTAVIYVNGHQGRLKLRCVLDSASKSSFLTLHAAERLGLDKIKTDFTVQGLNSSSAKINYLARASVSNSNQTFNLNVNMFLTTEIIKVHPSKKNISDFVIPQGIVLADEGFNQPSEISCLIGSEHFFDIFGTKQIRVPNSNFRLLDSKFGYVVTGSYIDEPCYFNHCFLSKGWNTLDKTLRSFWETENLSEEQPIISDELSYCEKHFEKTHFRKPCGRYSVSLPFKENIQENVNLGDSRSIASKRLDQLWRRLDRNPKLNNLYTKFIEEYLSLDYMEEITNIDDIASEEGFFLPHHGVLRAGNHSRPLRVVFNGSQKTDLDISHNDVLYKGGAIQDDLFSIMLCARKHAYFFQL